MTALTRKRPFEIVPGENHIECPLSTQKRSLSYDCGEWPLMTQSGHRRDSIFSGLLDNTKGISHGLRETS
jgi:hypothetical protein